MPPAKKAKAAENDSAKWRWLPDMPYDKAAPEGVVADMYAGAQVPDYVRQFVSYTCGVYDMEDFQVEAAAWVVLWAERASAERDFHARSLFRMVYSLCPGYCVMYVSWMATETGRKWPRAVAPTFAPAEQAVVRDTTKALFQTLEEHRTRAGGRAVALPSTLPQEGDTFWDMFVTLCNHLALGMHRVQLAASAPPVCPVEPLDIRFCVFKMCAMGDNSVDPECPWPAVLGAREEDCGVIRKVEKCMIVSKAVPRHRCAVTRASLQRNYAKAREAAATANRNVVYNMGCVTELHWYHMWAATDPAALWAAHRPKEHAHLAYIDALEDAQAQEEWWRVAPSVPGFALLCPPVKAVTGVSIKDPVTDSGKAWEFQCTLYNRRTKQEYTRWLPVMLLRQLPMAWAEPSLGGFCQMDCGFTRTPDTAVYNYALHRDIFPDGGDGW
jgi:hypothetical protein